MIVIKRFNVNKRYFISALTYWLFQNPAHTLECRDAKKVAIKVLRDTVFWYGRGNWHGDLAIHEAIGDSRMDEYNNLYAVVVDWVENNYPNFK